MGAACSSHSPGISRSQPRLPTTARTQRTPPVALPRAATKRIASATSFAPQSHTGAPADTKQNSTPADFHCLAGGTLVLVLGSVENWVPGPWALRLLDRRTAQSLDYDISVVVSVGERAFACRAVAVAASDATATGSASAGLVTGYAQLGRQCCRVLLATGEERSIVTVSLFGSRSAATPRPQSARIGALRDDSGVPALVPLARAFFDLGSLLDGGARRLHLTLFDDHPGLRREPSATEVTSSAKLSSRAPSIRPLLIAASDAAAFSVSTSDAAAATAGRASAPFATRIMHEPDSSGNGFYPPLALSPLADVEAGLGHILAGSDACHASLGLPAKSAGAAVSSPVGEIILSAAWLPVSPAASNLIE